MTKDKDDKPERRPVDLCWLELWLDCNAPIVVILAQLVDEEGSTQPELVGDLDEGAVGGPEHEYGGGLGGDRVAETLTLCRVSALAKTGNSISPVSVHSSQPAAHAQGHFRYSCSSCVSQQLAKSGEINRIITFLSGNKMSIKLRELGEGFSVWHKCLLEPRVITCG